MNLISTRQSKDIARKNYNSRKSCFLQLTASYVQKVVQQNVGDDVSYLIRTIYLTGLTLNTNGV